MSTPALVSIVTPCYNSAKFVRYCVESVLAQDYPRVEHIVQDGASTDGTVEILRQYGQRVNWVSEHDRGQADGLDKALKKCKGDFILVLNADDMLLPHSISWGVENMGKYPEAAVVYGDLRIVDETGAAIGVSYGPEPYSFERLFCCEDVPPAQAAFIRRTCLEEVGLGADPALDTCPDYEMWLRLGLKFPMKHVAEFVAEYRWHDNSEGRRGDMVEKFISAKRQVMDRVLDDPQTPGTIRDLRRRAHSGLFLWAAWVAGDVGATRMAWRYGLKGLWLNPSKHGLIRFMAATVLQSGLGRGGYHSSLYLLKKLRIVHGRTQRRAEY